MKFAVMCFDREDSLELRLATRAAHLAYLERHRQSIITCGPLLSEDGQRMVGSLLLVDVPNQQEVERFHSNDPYTLVGLFESVVIRPWHQVHPPVGVPT